MIPPSFDKKHTYAEACPTPTILSRAARQRERILLRQCRKKEERDAGKYRRRSQVFVVETGEHPDVVRQDEPYKARKTVDRQGRARELRDDNKQQSDRLDRHTQRLRCVFAEYHRIELLGIEDCDDDAYDRPGEKIEHVTPWRLRYSREPRQKIGRS